MTETTVVLFAAQTRGGRNSKEQAKSLQYIIFILKYT